MQPHFQPLPEPFERAFPSLPIITPDTPRLSDREKYGALFHLGLAGLVVVIGLLTWFAWSAWSLRSVLVNVFVLHEPKRSESDRIQAAYALTRDPNVNQRQLWDIALSKPQPPLPPLARYLVAEGLTAEAVSADPRGYAVSVARSEGWPDWLRLLLLRPMAYRAAAGQPLPREPLEELAGNPDPAIQLWAQYILAASLKSKNSDASAYIQTAADTADTRQPLARYLLDALNSARLVDRVSALDAATRWLRHGHPQASPIWEAWTIRGARVVPNAAPKLH